MIYPLLLMLVLRQPSPTTGSIAKTVVAPKAVVLNMFSAFNRHDAAAMQEMYAADARLTSSDFCHVRGRTDVKRTYDALFKTFPDILDNVEVVLVEGDRVAVRFTATSKRGKMSLKIHTFLRVRDGRIVNDDTVFDTGGRPCDP